MSEYRGGDPGADTLEDWMAAENHGARPQRGVADPRAALARVRALHGECDARCGLCHECASQLPCATLRTLDGE